ncbi:MAG TPA: UPF0182 family protein [Candidatus Acidoferrales bacterium]|nr:UPF0182 family protein [Candidatus Acidoferrales bacterium]
MKRFSGLFVFLIFLATLFVGQAIALYTDWLWFQEVGFTQVFAKTLTIKFVLAVVFGALFFALIYFNVRFAAQRPQGFRFFAEENVIELPSPDIVDPMIRRLLFPGALVLALMSAPQAASHWETVILFLNALPFGIADPLFGLDVGFYVFRFPALLSLYNWLMFVLVLALAATAATYLLYQGIRLTPNGLFLTERARRHLLLLTAALLLVKAGGYALDSFNLLYSTRAAAFGAGYTDVYANLPALRLLVVVCVAAAALALAQIYRPGYRYLFGGVGAALALHLLGLIVYPALLQRLRVVPNEIAAERPYIERNISFTRRAYGLDKVESKDFPAAEELTAADLKRNDATIKNVRLWDHRPLLATYAQLQEIRTYYKFVDVDNDRYHIDGTYRQVMLSARELSHEHLPSRIWINEHLTYTHGYGVVFGPVNQVTPEGLPEFFIKDIPPVSQGDLKITRPEIYYGELGNSYVVVKTNAQELDYPAGDQNVYTKYEGRGGVPINSFWRKLVFSARYATLRILLSNDINRESRIMYYRRIHERVQKIAPFITLDRDAYLVIAGGGRLFWIIDGYTTSEHYPYSQPTRRVGNYIRNSVKAVVDAYHGSVTFFLSDPEDPVVQAYARAFPGLFRPLEAMPEGLLAHIRYPQDLFEIQARIYATYHMQDPQVFYNKEDLLSIPRTTVEGREIEMEPYYTIMRLPGEKKEEFILLLPFTPNRRDNMRAWLAARSDPPNYGKLIALDFPKAKLVYGPKQIEARINQDTFISQQLSLWNQQGSQVIRGSLLAIPIEQSLLYVQPLYLAAADKGSLPELKRVITAFGNQIAMEETLENSLQRIFGGRAAKPPAQAVVLADKTTLAKSQADRALEHYQRAQDFLRQGNWAGFGDELKRLEQALKEMQKTP